MFNYWPHFFLEGTSRLRKQSLRFWSRLYFFPGSFPFAIASIFLFFANGNLDPWQLVDAQDIKAQELGFPVFPSRPKDFFFWNRPSTAFCLGLPQNISVVVVNF